MWLIKTGNYDTLRHPFIGSTKSLNIGNKMVIARDQVEKVARLAKIAVDDATLDEVTSRIDSILQFVEHIQAADTADIEPLSHPLDGVQRLRADEVTEVDQRAEFQAIAPATEDGLYLVPKVID